MPTAEQRILKEIERISKSDPVHMSFERGKTFYDPLDLPQLLDDYLSRHQLKKGDAAKLLGISRGSVSRIVTGGHLSDSMLFRVRKAMEVVAAKQTRRRAKITSNGIYPGDWRRTRSQNVQVAIAVVSDRLIFLKRVILESNSINAKKSAIDPIQKAQLIALLESTLAAITAPLIERDQTHGFFRWLMKLGRRAIEKGIEKKISDAIDGAVEAGEELVRNLPDTSNTDLGNIIA